MYWHNFQRKCHELSTVPEAAWQAPAVDAAGASPLWTLSHTSGDEHRRSIHTTETIGYRHYTDARLRQVSTWKVYTEHIMSVY